MWQFNSEIYITAFTHYSYCRIIKLNKRLEQNESECLFMLIFLVCITISDLIASSMPDLIASSIPDLIASSMPDLIASSQVAPLSVVVAVSRKHWWGWVCVLGSASILFRECISYVFETSIANYPKYYISLHICDWLGSSNVKFDDAITAVYF